MSPLGIVLIGVGIVIGGVLILRLHAFLALILAAIAVAALTPRADIEGHLLAQKAITAHREPHTEQIVVEGAVEQEDRLLVVRKSAGAWQEVARVEVASVPEPTSGALRLIARPDREAEYIWQDGDRIVQPAAWRSIRRQVGQTVGERVAVAFGDTCGKIGILIALAAIIGKCLLDSGSADRIVRSAVRVTGQRGAPAAFLVQRLRLGDSRVLRHGVLFDDAAGQSVARAHGSRLPVVRIDHHRRRHDGPFAGPSDSRAAAGGRAAGGRSGADDRRRLLGGPVQQRPGYLFAWWVNRRIGLPLRESADFSREDMQRMAAMDERELPPLGRWPCCRS
jgi:gluconate:H+ symporter, GntP family